MDEGLWAGLALQCEVVWEEGLVEVLVEVLVVVWEVVCLTKDEVWLAWSQFLGSPLLWSGNKTAAEPETKTISNSSRLLCNRSRGPSTTRAAMAGARAARGGSRW